MARSLLILTAVLMLFSASSAQAYDLFEYFPCKPGVVNAYERDILFFTDKTHEFSALTGTLLLQASEMDSEYIYVNVTEDAMYMVGQYDIEDQEWFDISACPCKLLTRNMAIGDTDSGSIYPNCGASPAVTIQYELVGLDDVIAYDGTSYQDTLKMRYSVYEQGSWTYTEDVWLAKSVGVVKAQRVNQISSTENGCFFTCGSIDHCDDTTTQATLLGLANFNPYARTALEYYVPYIPTDDEFPIVGFGLSNVGNDEANTITISYYNNAGQLLDQEAALSIAANSQTSLTKSVTTQVEGWAHISTTAPLTGMSLIFDAGGMFDVDLTAETSKHLIVSHMDASTDTESWWKSTAMLCNPNDSQAEVILTFHAKDTGATATQELTIPAMGSVQYELSVFDGAGAVEIDSSQTLAGFLLYDGRNSGYNWLGGLSIQIAD